MPNGKYHEFLDNLFRNILKQPMMSEYCHRMNEYERCDATHIGKCRRVCYNCSGVKLAIVNSDGSRVRTFQRKGVFISELIAVCGIRDNKFHQEVKRYLSAKLPPPNGSQRAKLIINPMCDSCEYATEWKRKNWRRYVVRAINGGANEGKELRKIFYEKEIRRTIRRLLAFFDCITLTSLRDGLVGVIDYSYDQ